MTDYSKEPVVITEKNHNISLGDKVIVSSFYLTNYPAMLSLADKPAEVMKMTTRAVKVLDIPKEDRPMYAEKYGKREVYDVVCLYIKCPNNNQLFMVSPFGYEKESK